MKKFLLLIALMFLPCSAFQSNLTVEIASRMNYPNTVYGLRDKVQDFLDQIKVSMMMDVQELRSENLGYRSASLARGDQEMYYDISARFDREFERVSRNFVLGSAHLDEIDAPVKEKEAFINDMKNDLLTSIQALLDSYGQQFQIKT